MPNLYKFTQDEKKAIENNPIPMIVYQHTNTGLTPLLFSRGSLTFFRMNKDELYDYVTHMMGTKNHPQDSARLYKEKKEKYKDISKTINLDFRTLLPGDSEYIWLKVTGYIEQTTDGFSLCYCHYCDTTSIHDSEQKIKDVLDTKSSKKNIIDNTHGQSIINKALSKAQFIYAVYDVEKKRLINGNLYDNLLESGAIYSNFPDFLFDMKIHPEDDREAYMSMMQQILDGSDKVSGVIRAFDFSTKKYHNIMMTMYAIYVDNHKLKYILCVSESLNTFNEIYSMSQNVLKKNGLISWNYIITDNSYNINIQNFESPELHENANLLFTAISKKEIRIPEAMIKDSLKTAYDIVTLKDDSDTVKKFEITYTLINDQNHKPLSILGIARDVTKYYEMEKDYIKKLERANIAKAGFLSRLSHDMRTPLGAIISLSEFGIDECENEKTLEYFKKINDNSAYLLSFISDVLEAKKITNDEMEIQKGIFRLSRVLNQIVSVVQQRAIEKQIDFSINFDFVNNDIYLNSDEKKIKQVVINLLTNSIKYTPKKGSVKFKVTTKVLNDKLDLLFTVSDNGVGMSKQFQEHMFDEYSQEHNRLSFEEEGTGLGLSIVKKTVDLLQGTIICISDLDKGTTFTTHFTCSIATRQEIETSRRKFNEEKLGLLKNKKILLCEDKAINILIIKKILSSIGVITDVAENGFEGVHKVKDNHYDLVLMDIRMPVMDGLTATKKIRLFNKTIPILALSANAHQEDIEKSINSGMNSHLSKPIEKQKLFEALVKYIVLNT